MYVFFRTSLWNALIMLEKIKMMLEMMQMMQEKRGVQPTLMTLHHQRKLVSTKVLGKGNSNKKIYLCNVSFIQYSFIVNNTAKAKI